MSDIIPFKFEGAAVRVIEAGDSFEVVAADVVEGVGAVWNGSAAIAHVPEEWRGVRSVLTPGGAQQMAVLKEPGLYFYLNRSDKPAALPMQKWVAGEVLPAIRKTGSYAMPGAPGPLKVTSEAARAFPALFRVARLVGCDKNAAAISANQAVLKVSGVDLLGSLGQRHLEATNQESRYYTPTELGRMCESPVSARNINLLLAEAGLQMKRADSWEATDAGREFAHIFDTGKKHGSGVPVTQLKWSATVLPLLGVGTGVPA